MEGRTYMARTMTLTVTAPHDVKKGEKFQVTVEVDGTGITADIRALAREYKAGHPNCTTDEVMKHILSVRPSYKVATVQTQVRAA